MSATDLDHDDDDDDDDDGDADADADDDDGDDDDGDDGDRKLYILQSLLQYLRKSLLSPYNSFQSKRLFSKQNRRDLADFKDGPLNCCYCNTEGRSIRVCLV